MCRYQVDIFFILGTIANYPELKANRYTWSWTKSGTTEVLACLAGPRERERVSYGGTFACCTIPNAYRERAIKVWESLYLAAKNTNKGRHI